MTREFAITDLSNFFSPEDYKEHSDKYAHLVGPNGSLLFVACDAGQKLAEDVQREYQNLLKRKFDERLKRELEGKTKGQRNNILDEIKRKGQRIFEIPLMKGITTKFEGKGHDGTNPRLPHSVKGADAFVFQNCMDKREDSKSLNDNLYQAIQMIDTLKTYNATHVTVIFPYFPYSRQDKPSHQKREVAQTVLAADQLVRAGADNLISYHPHSTSLAGQKDRPYEYISGIDLFASVFSEYKKDPNTVAVSTDSGGSKETKALAKRLGIAYCPGIKDRPKHEKVETIGVGGDLEGKTRAIVMDDETASFSSVLGVLELISRVGVKEINVGISHTRLSADHLPKLVLAHEKYNMVAYHTTDSVPQIEALSKLPFVHIHSLANMWANVINRLHYTSSVSKLFPSYESK